MKKVESLQVSGISVDRGSFCLRLHWGVGRRLVKVARGFPL